MKPQQCLCALLWMIQRRNVRVVMSLTFMTKEMPFVVYAEWDALDISDIKRPRK